MPEERKEPIEEISKEILELQKSIEHYKEALNKTYKLLEKADKKLKEDRFHYDHWLKVIEKLEKSLIEFRGILQGKETRLLELKKRYYELTTEKERRVEEGKLSEEEKRILEGEKLIDINYARELLSTPSEKLAELTLSEISQIVSGMRIQEGVAVGSEQIEVGEVESKSNVIENIKGMLVTALKKIWDNRVDELSDEERKVILKAFHSLDEKRRRTPQEERLHRVMSAMVRAAFQNYRLR